MAPIAQYQAHPDSIRRIQPRAVISTIMYAMVLFEPLGVGPPDALFCLELSLHPVPVFHKLIQFYEQVAENATR
jgi:hypothetical protein